MLTLSHFKKKSNICHYTIYMLVEFFQRFTINELPLSLSFSLSLSLSFANTWTRNKDRRREEAPLLSNNQVLLRIRINYYADLDPGPRG